MGGGGAFGERGVSRLQARGRPLLEGGGQRPAALVANLVAVENKPLEPRRCPLLEGGGQRRAALVANLVVLEIELLEPRRCPLSISLQDWLACLVRDARPGRVRDMSHLGALQEQRHLVRRRRLRRRRSALQRLPQAARAAGDCGRQVPRRLIAAVRAGRRCARVRNTRMRPSGAGGEPRPPECFCFRLCVVAGVI